MLFPGTTPSDADSAGLGQAREPAHQCVAQDPEAPSRLCTRCSLPDHLPVLPAGETGAERNQAGLGEQSPPTSCICPGSMPPTHPCLVCPGQRSGGAVLLSAAGVVAHTRTCEQHAPTLHRVTATWAGSGAAQSISLLSFPISGL